MGFIEYEHEGTATIRDELHHVIGYAFKNLSDTHWELSLDIPSHRDRILRALDSHSLLY